MIDREAITVVVGRFETPLVGHALEHVLGADPRVRVVASDLECVELERIVAQQAPRVALLDEVVDDLMLVRLKSRQPGMGVLVLARDPAYLYGTLLVAAGATCVATSASPTDLLKGLHLAARGRPTFFRACGSQVVRRDLVVDGRLTLRETDVLGHLSLGRSNAQIARALGINVETARTHVAKIPRKLDTQSRQELVGVSIRNRPVGEDGDDHW